MPEYILPGADAPAFTALDDFTRGYIEALFFTNNGPEDGQLGDTGFDDLDPETLASIIADCAAFQQSAATLLEQAYAREYDATQAGRDFWFTRCGHGVGYWDRAQLENDTAEYERLTAEMVAHRTNSEAWDAALAKRQALEAESLGEKLSDLARKAGNRDAYLGDDGRVYLS